MANEKKKTKIQSDVEETLMSLINEAADDPSAVPIESPDEAESHWQSLQSITISKNIENLNNSTLIKNIKKINNKKDRPEGLDISEPKIEKFQSYKPEISGLINEEKSESIQSHAPQLSQLNLKTMNSNPGDLDKTIVATQFAEVPQSIDPYQLSNEQELKKAIEVNNNQNNLNKYDDENQKFENKNEQVIPLFVNKVVDDKIIKTEQLKLAHTRITQLEKEVEELRLDNEKLATAANILETKNLEMSEYKIKSEKIIESLEIKNIEEIKIFKNQLESTKEELKNLKIKNSELENRLAQDIRLSKSRERELENRLELLKLEKSSLASSKDEMLLRLKKDIDQLRYDLEVYKKKNIDLQKNIELNEDQIRRTIRALRLALTSLEVADENKSN